MSKKAPDRGDIIWLDFNPTKGHEQQGTRPAIVISLKVFNSQTGLCWVVPITNTQRGIAFEVPIKGKKGTITGYALTQQIRAIDYKARNVRHEDKATNDEISAVMARVQAIIA